MALGLPAARSSVGLGRPEICMFVLAEIAGFDAPVAVINHFLLPRLIEHLTPAVPAGHRTKRNRRTHAPSGFFLAGSRQSNGVLRIDGDRGGVHAVLNAAAQATTSQGFQCRLLRLI